jgi:lipopolysaccharide export LptBFGC system permease protein LptF
MECRIGRNKNYGERMKKLFVFVLLALTASTFTLAQTATPEINKTQRNQRARIHQGVKSGELTRREARSVVKQQVHIQREKRLAKADGIVTPKERKHIRLDQKRASRNIAAKKHNRFERKL